MPTETKKTRGSSLGLSTFEVVGRALSELSLTRTARELGVSQPTVSFHVDRFESHFGYPILRRVGNMLQRTEAGDRAMEICRSISDLVEELDGLQSGKRPVSIAMPPALLDTYLNRSTLPAFGGRHYVLVSDCLNDQRQRFMRKELGAVAWYLREGETAPEHAIPINFVWVGHKETARRSPMPIARFPMKSQVEEALASYQGQALHKTEVRLETSDLSQIRNFVARGEAVTYLPEVYAKRYDLPLLNDAVRFPDVTVKLALDYWPELMPLRDFEAYHNDLRALLSTA